MTQCAQGSQAFRVSHHGKEQHSTFLHCLEKKADKKVMVTMCSINKSKTLECMTSPEIVLTLVWQATAKVIIIPPVLRTILACFTKVNNAFCTALAF